MIAQEPFRSLCRLQEAWSALSTKIRPLSPRRVSVLSACGRVLAEDVVAPIDVPPFDRAAMDGYAVRAEDVEGASFSSPRILRLRGSVEIGVCPRERIGPGEAVRIDNGALLPEGADAVVPLEYVSERGEYVEIYSSVPKWGNVSRKGEDIAKGEVVLNSGRVLTPWDVALLKALGVSQVLVRVPRVAVISTGAELVDDAALLEPGKVVDTNRLMLELMLVKSGCEIIGSTLLSRDDLESVSTVIERFSQVADLIVITGGCSVGRKDYVAKALSELGDLVFHGVAIRPGMPTAAAIMGDCVAIGLPGSPAAAYIAFKLFVEPIVYLLTLRREDIPPPLEARTEVKIDSTPGFIDIVRVRLISGRVVPVVRRGATVLSSISRSEGVVAVPEDYEGLEEGARVRVYLHSQPWLGILEGNMP